MGEQEPRDNAIVLMSYALSPHAFDTTHALVALLERHGNPPWIPDDWLERVISYGVDAIHCEATVTPDDLARLVFFELATPPDELTPDDDNPFK